MGLKRWLAAVAAGSALTAACGGPITAAPPSSSPPNSSAPAAPTPAVVAWVDVMCAVQDLTLWNPPPPVKHTQPLTEADRAPIVAYLTDGHTTFSQAKSMLDGLGPAPVPGGDEVVTSTRTALGQMADKFAEYAQEAAVFPASGLHAPYDVAAVDLATWLPAHTFSQLAERNPTVAAARKQAKRC